MTELQELKNNQRKINNEKEFLNTQVEHLKGELAKVSGENRLHKDMEKLIIELQDSIKLKDESSNRLHQEIEKLQSGNSLIVNQQQEYIDSLLQDNSVLNEKYQNISEKFSKLQSQYDKLMAQNENLVTENTLISAQLNGLTKIEQKPLQFEESSIFFKNESLKLKESLEKHSKRINDCTKNFKKKKFSKTRRKRN